MTEPTLDQLSDETEILARMKRQWIENNARLVDCTKPSDALDQLVRVVIHGPFDKTRCPVCGWPLHEKVEEGCTEESCSQRPVPARRADQPLPYSSDPVVAFQLLSKFSHSSVERSAGFIRVQVHCGDVNNDFAQSFGPLEDQALLICLTILESYGVSAFVCRACSGGCFRYHDTKDLECKACGSVALMRASTRTS